MGESLSVVIPTFNEKENIQVLVPNILDIFKNNKIDGEVIIVEDSSTDGSEAVLKELAGKYSAVNVIFRQPPGSLSKSWHEGFLAASKEFIVCIDADLCHDPHYFPEMLQEMQSSDIVIGSRYLDAASKGMKDKSIIANLCSKLGQCSSRMIFGFKQTDTSHSFRMFKKELFDRIAGNLSEEGNVYLIQFLYEALKAGAIVTEIPIVYGKRIYGKTKLSISRETARYFQFVLRTIYKKLAGHDR